MGILPPGLALATVSFVKALRQLGLPLADRHYLSVDSRLAIALSQSISLIRVTPTFFLMTPKAQAQDNRCFWLLGFTSATAALFACRLMNIHAHSPYKVAEILVEHGVAFLTPISVPRAPSSPLISSSHTTPFRPSGYKFAYSDYITYVQQPRFSPRARCIA